MSKMWKMFFRNCNNGTKGYLLWNCYFFSGQLAFFDRNILRALLFSRLYLKLYCFCLFDFFFRFIYVCQCFTHMYFCVSCARILKLELWTVVNWPLCWKSNPRPLPKNVLLNIVPLLQPPDLWLYLLSLKIFVC